jgi:protein tyrosine phosphatase (PTP) superfamily phosphohydrolase (DUF442 family)
MIAALLVVIAQVAAPAAIDPAERDKAMAELRGPAGPVRFAQVSECLFRGGQPNARQLQLLRKLGVDNVINLRSGSGNERDAEEKEAKRLGMTWHNYPFNATFGASVDLIKTIVASIDPHHVTYVHCHVGRDRTSLVIAMWRVMVDHWEPDKAWQHDAVDFGHEPGFWYRGIRNSFERATKMLEGSR